MNLPGRINWLFIIVWLILFTFCGAVWYFIIYAFVKLIAKAQGWA